MTWNVTRNIFSVNVTKTRCDILIVSKSFICLDDLVKTEAKNVGLVPYILNSRNTFHYSQSIFKEDINLRKDFPSFFLIVASTFTSFITRNLGFKVKNVWKSWWICAWLNCRQLDHAIFNVFFSFKKSHSFWF